MSVVGIDFGNLNTIVAVARNKGIDVITNDTSNRATPSMVTISESQRYSGESAKTQEMMNFKSCIGSMKRLLARPAGDAEVDEFEKKFVNFKMERGEADVEASVFYQGEQQNFTLTQVVAMFFNHVKDFTSDELEGKPVTDVVISVPGWFSDRQRRAILDATKIAHINCLRLMNDLTASALGYGITKTDLPDLALTPTAKPRIVCFVDFGHSSYQVSIVALQKGKLTVKGTAYNRNLGGRNFDELLVDHFCKEFKTKYKIDVHTNAKAKQRLRLQCEKVKKILSANAQTVLNIECLMDDKDVRSDIKRDDFEEWVGPLRDAMIKTLQQAVDNASISINDVDAVELVGGATRMPIFKKTVAEFFGGSLEGENKLSTTLNQDEAVARGCALQCAILSPTFKVREFALVDWNPFPVQLSWDKSVVPDNHQDNECFMDAFPVANVIPSVKSLKLTTKLTDQPLNVNITGKYTHDAVDHGLPVGVGTHIGEWTIQGIKQTPERDGETKAADSDIKATIKIKAKLDGNGVINIESAYHQEDFTTQVPVEEPAAPAPKKEEPKKTTKTDKKDDKKKSKKEKKEAEEAPVTPESATEETAGSPAADAMETDAPVIEAAPVEVTMRTKNNTRKIDLVVVSKTHHLSSSEIERLQALEGQMESSDKLIIDTAERRNALESYVYETRSHMDSQWKEFVESSARDAYVQQLNDMESWLYTEEGESATKSVYVEKLNGLRTIGDATLKRVREFENRPHAEKMMRDYVNSVVIGIKADEDKYSHIDKAELEKVVKECNKEMDWLNEMIGKQNEKKKWDEVVVTCEEIKSRKEKLFFFSKEILGKPKPAPVVEEKKVEKMDEDTKEEVPTEGASTEKKEEESKKEDASMDLD